MAGEIVYDNMRTAVARFAVRNKDKKPTEDLLRMIAEYGQKEVRRKKQRIRRAAFPYQKQLQDLIKKELPQDAQSKLATLERIDFIKDGQNLILAGNPGSGKTHIAIGLAINACTLDFSVFFTTIPRLITQINEARSQRTLRTLESRFENRQSSPPT